MKKSCFSTASYAYVPVLCRDTRADAVRLVGTATSLSAVREADILSLKHCLPLGASDLDDVTKSCQQRPQPQHFW